MPRRIKRSVLAVEDLQSGTKCKTVRQNLSSGHIFWHFGQNFTTWGGGPRSGGGVERGFENISAIDPTRPLKPMATLVEFGKNQPKIASEAPSKNIHLLKTLHLGSASPRQLQHFKTAQRGDPYQLFFATVFHGEVVNPEI